MPKIGGEMKKSIVTLLFAILFVTSLLGGETQFMGENWFRYTHKLYDDNTEQSEFAVKRIYLRWNHKYNDKLESRITTEFFASDKDADVNGAGLKIKDAYVKFKGIVPEGDITGGLQKTYFGRVYDWEYWPVVKAMGEMYGIIHGSRDFGVSVGGYIPKGYGTWRVEAVNGEGYKKSGDNINTEPAYLGDIRFIPVPGFTLGGSAITENTGNPPYDKRMYYTGLIRFAKGPIDIWAQYLGGEKGDPDSPVSSMGYMVFPKFHLGQLFNLDMEIFLRYDFWDPDTDTGDDGSYLYVGGFNYYFSRRAKGKPGVMFQFALERVQPELSDSKPVDKIMAQLRWEWNTPKFQEK
jgi:hypothetical protein